jgi:hypothetical protein
VAERQGLLAERRLEAAGAFSGRLEAVERALDAVLKHKSDQDACEVASRELRQEVDSVLAARHPLELLFEFPETKSGTVVERAQLAALFCQLGGDEYCFALASLNRKVSSRYPDAKADITVEEATARTELEEAREKCAEAKKRFGVVRSEFVVAARAGIEDVHRPASLP